MKLSLVTGKRAPLLCNVTLNVNQSSKLIFKALVSLRLFIDTLINQPHHLLTQFTNTCTHGNLRIGIFFLFQCKIFKGIGLFTQGLQFFFSDDYLAFYCSLLLCNCIIFLITACAKCCSGLLSETLIFCLKFLQFCFVQFTGCSYLT